MDRKLLKIRKVKPEDLIRIVHESRRFGLGGVIIFDYAHFGCEYMNILTASAFNDGSRQRVAYEAPKVHVCTKCKKDKKCKKCRKEEKRLKKEMEKRAKKMKTKN